MNDLEIAKKALKENNLSIVFVKDGKVIFKGNSKGVMDLILAIDRFGSRLENSSVADSIVGKAAASLSIFLKVNSVFARKISKLAVDILKEKNIHFEYDELVEKILNRNGTGICPLEKISLRCNSPEEIYREIKSFLKL